MKKNKGDIELFNNLGLEKEEEELQQKM